MRRGAKVAPKIARLPSRVQFKLSKAYRAISTRYPPVDLFERVADPEDFAALIDLECLTNPRINEDVGDLSAIAKEDLRTGLGSTPVMAAFTHYGREGRFNTTDFGVYYASDSPEGAAMEWAYHMGSEYRATGAPRGDTAAARLYIGKIDGYLSDVRKRPAYHLPDDYRLGQVLALRLRSAGHDGVLYQSVRHPGGLCVAALRPPIVGNVKESAKLQFEFDGRCMTSFFNYSTDKRITIPPYLRSVEK